MGDVRDEYRLGGARVMVELAMCRTGLDHPTAIGST
jgi:hypothetical protein